MAAVLLVALALTAAQQPQGGSRRQAATLVQKGDQLREQRKYEEALKAYADALDLNPDLIAAHLHRAWILNELGKHAEAVRDCNFVLSAVSENDDPAARAAAYRERGYARFRLDRPDGAVTDLGEAIRLEPNNALGYSLRADVYIDQDEYRKALPDATRYVQLVPDAPSGYVRRGRIQTELKHYDEAVEDFNAAIQRNANYAAAYAYRGEANLKRKKPDAALADLNRAVEMDGNVAAYYEIRGRIHGELGHAKEADADAARAKQLKAAGAKK